MYQSLRAMARHNLLLTCEIRSLRRGLNIVLVSLSVRPLPSQQWPAAGSRASEAVVVVVVVVAAAAAAAVVVS